MIMAQWQSQEEKSSISPRTEQAVDYMEREIGRATIEEAMEQYFLANPSGKHVTLACLKAIGERRLRDLSAKRAKMKSRRPDDPVTFDMVKKHAGLWIAMVLNKKYGARNVLTYRRFKDGPNCPQRVPDDWKQDVPFVTSFTPHTLKQEADQNQMKASKD